MAKQVRFVIPFLIWQHRIRTGSLPTNKNTSQHNHHQPHTNTITHHYHKHSLVRHQWGEEHLLQHRVVIAAVDLAYKVLFVEVGKVEAFFDDEVHWRTHREVVVQELEDARRQKKKKKEVILGIKKSMEVVCVCICISLRIYLWIILSTNLSIFQPVSFSAYLILSAEPSFFFFLHLTMAT